MQGIVAAATHPRDGSTLPRGAVIGQCRDALTLWLSPWPPVPWIWPLGRHPWILHNQTSGFHMPSWPCLPHGLYGLPMPVTVTMATCTATLT